MPDPPPVGLFTQYVLENPYPLGLLALVVAAVLAWTALRVGRPERVVAAGILAVIGAGILLVGTFVVTSGEHARRVVLEVVDAAVAGDVVTAGALFTDDATLALGSPTNPGYPRDRIERGLDQLAGRYRIADNQVTILDGFTESSRQATVHLGCRTTPEGGFGPVPTLWVLRVELQPDGTWKISRVAWVGFAGRTPDSPLGW